MTRACDCGWLLPDGTRVGTDDAAVAEAVRPYRDRLIVDVRCPVCGKRWEAKDEVLPS